jgi:RNA polymerase primary sigma factor
MHIWQQSSEVDSFAHLDNSDIDVLGPRKERRLLQELARCKDKLSQALAGIEGIEILTGADDPRTLAHCISAVSASDGSNEVRLGAILRKYSELRDKLALANMRLVAHVAKQFRDRGIPYADLLQEGFCGLLEAIDRFDLTHQTKLATYATWWIRQSMQCAVASGAYPVRLTPRHLRQLAQNQEEMERLKRDHAGSNGDPDANTDSTMTELIHRIHTATRPAFSLDATYYGTTSSNLLQPMSDPEGDHTGTVDTEETVEKLMKVLRPREQQVLSLRFGLSGGERLSLSQVGKVLEVSKERVRQIQDRALQKLRDVAEVENLRERLALNV